MAGRRLQNPEITIPRAKPVDPKKSRANAKFKELMRDKDFLKQVREESKKSVFWDGNSGKSARENRKRIRDLFEEYVQSQDWDGGRSYRGPSFQASYFEPVLMQAEPGEMPIAKIWDIEMFTARCKEIVAHSLRVFLKEESDRGQRQQSCGTRRTHCTGGVHASTPTIPVTSSEVGTATYQPRSNACLYSFLLKPVPGKKTTLERKNYACFTTSSCPKRAVHFP